MDFLAFGAHPDDIEFGMGASVLKFIDQHYTGAFCVLSRGGSGSYGTPREREKEMIRAAEHLGVPIEILDFEDCRIFDTWENRLTLAGIIRKYRPHVVFAPYHSIVASPDDGRAHPDHLATGVLVTHAVRFARFSRMPLEGEPWKVKQALYYILPAFQKPSFILDVSDYMEDWERLCSVHMSQMKLKDGEVISFLKRIRSYYGLMMNTDFGEGFISDAPVPLDLKTLL